MQNRAIVWFRNDLRLHDNEALVDACMMANEVIPVYIFDDRVFKSKTKFGFEKTGIHRSRFILESVEELRNNLRAMGSELYIRIGKPEEELFKIAQKYRTRWVFCNRERTQEEVDVQNALEKKLWTIGQELRYSRGKMLYYTSDLPFPITHTPDSFVVFRKEVEKFVPIRKPLEKPDTKPLLKGHLDLETGAFPELSDFGFDEVNGQKEGCFRGGENAGMERLRFYLWESDLMKKDKKHNNEALGWRSTSRFSPWISQGCLSPKQVYYEVKKYEETNTHNESTQRLINELLWRDYYRLMGKKHENKIFQINGYGGKRCAYREENIKLFQSWKEGKTGIPFVDANIREMNATGFMSNRGRQVVSGFLVIDMGMNWLMGAEYFESMLLDYDPCSNYGNWVSIAGVDNDPKAFKYYNVLSQAKKYDPEGEYVKKWLPELSNLPKSHIHRPFDLSSEEQSKFGFSLEKDYTEPIIDFHQPHGY